VITDELLDEANGQADATIIHLMESISHLKKVNEELKTKYDKQREFVSLAAHELRSPIWLEYEFEESNKKEITLRYVNSKKSLVQWRVVRRNRN
jgi:hypothetical protein